MVTIIEKKEETIPGCVSKLTKRGDYVEPRRSMWNTDVTTLKICTKNNSPDAFTGATFFTVVSHDR